LQTLVVYLPVTMMDPALHFQNFRNSCSIDTFLEIFFFCWFSKLKDAYLGPFLALAYDVSIKRLNCTNAMQLKAIRETVWDWLETHCSSFTRRGSIDANFDQIIDQCVLNTYERSTFSSPHAVSAFCPICKTSCSLSLEEVGRVVLFPDRIRQNDFCLQKTLSSLTEPATVDSTKLSHRRCPSCNRRGLTVTSVEAHWAPILNVKLPITGQGVCV